MSAAAAVTPVVLTYDEEPNIARTLTSLAWAQDVVVLDSGSTDATEAIARSFANVRWHTRRFDRHDAQWRHALLETGITTEYALALDADMWMPPSFLHELEQHFLAGGYDAAWVPFEWHFYGRPLAGSVYPTQLRLFRPAQVRITQPGHTQEFHVDGTLYRFRARLVHDDRKPLERWTAAQLSYSRLEEDRLCNAPTLRWRDRLRRSGLMPAVAGVLAYLRAGGPFRGAAAARYAYERATYECLLAIRMMDARMQTAARTDPRDSGASRLSGKETQHVR